MTLLRNISLLAVAALAACGSGQELDESLKRDLGLVGDAPKGGLELAPQSRPTQVVSTIEGGPAAKPASSPQRTRKPISPRPRVQAPVAESPRIPASVVEPEVEAPAPLPAVTPTPRPSSAPQGAGPAPAGGWKTIDQIAPKLPFPIKP